MKSKVTTSYKQRERGFTLVELLVSIGIFALVATMVIVAVTSLIAAGEKSQTENSVMSNLNVALEDMSRTVRTGYNYTCPTNMTANQGLTSTSCSGSNTGVNFLQFQPASGGPSDREVYGLVPGSNGCGRIEEQFDGNGQIPLTADEVCIKDLRFYVLNAGSNSAQPRVLMTVLGYVQTKNSIQSYFNLQTTMTQRLYEGTVTEF